MRQSLARTQAWRRALYGLGLCSVLGLTGCTVSVGGQTLPSAWYLTDDIQYFPPGPEFKLSREAAAQQAFRENVALEAAP